MTNRSHSSLSDMRDRKLTLVFHLSLILALIPFLDAYAQPTSHYERFVAADEANDIHALERLSAELQNSPSGILHHLSMLSRSVAAYRGNRFADCLRTIDSTEQVIVAPDDLLLAVQYRFKGNAISRSGDVRKGVEFLDKGLALADSVRFPRERVDLLVVKAERLQEIGGDREALTSLSEAERIAQRSGYHKGECMVLINLGVMQFSQSRWDDAQSTFQRTLTCALDAGSERIARNAAGNIAAAAANSGNTGEALRLFDSLALSLDNKEPLHQAMLLSFIGYLRGQQGDSTGAINSLLRSIRLNEELENIKGAALAKQYLSGTLWDFGRRTEAISIRKDVIGLAKEVGDIQLEMLSHWKLSSWYEEIGNYPLALNHARMMEELDDSLETVRYDDKMALFEVRFETERKERRIAEQDQALALAAAEDRRKSTQRNALIGATALLALIALLLYRAMRNRQRLAKKEKELHDEQVDQLLSQQEMKSINAMLEGQEQERERVSKELHDHVGHLLGTIKHQLGELETQVADVKTEQTAQYRKVTGLLDNAAGELRRISHDMAAATLNRFGLEKALKDLRETIHINGRMQVELNTFGLERTLGRGVEIAVYRIIQEAVSNVLKHAEATELSIAVTHAPGRLSVVVSDNGIGFDTAATSGGVGLTNIRSRAAALGAQVQIDSAPGKGTTINVECAVLE